MRTINSAQGSETTNTVKDATASVIGGFILLDLIAVRVAHKKHLSALCGLCVSSASSLIALLVFLARRYGLHDIQMNPIGVLDTEVSLSPVL